MAETVRLNKCIADSGICSRREADQLIQSGQVTVNGKRITTLGVVINPEKNTVLVNGNELPNLRRQYILLHKPRGYITTRSDEKSRATIYDLLPPRLHSVDPAGRLDRDSSGALILSNDGDFIFQLTHPKFHLPKVYRVTVDKPLKAKCLEQLFEGIPLEPEGKLAKVTALELETPVTLKLTLVTGYNRQIRRSLEALGYTVETLKRLSIGPVSLGSLKPGKIRTLTPAEVKTIQKSAEKTLKKLQPAKKPTAQNRKSSGSKKPTRGSASPDAKTTAKKRPR